MRIHHWTAKAFAELRQAATAEKSGDKTGANWHRSCAASHFRNASHVAGRS